jgi:hypothetical protein
MTQEKERILFEKFPFVRGSGDITKDLMDFGFECGDGWFQILYALFDAIQNLTVVPPDFKVVQVKEKFGTLRVYTDFSSEDINHLISLAEDASSLVCESCGAPGKLTRNHGWFKTLCDKCSY